MLEFLQSWYAARCNGSWEKGLGITIETLASPGWAVTVDLTDTPLERRKMARMKRERSPTDWIDCAVEHGRFRGEGDPGKLAEIIGVFQRWAVEQK